jgi:hypothetical protein
VATLSSWRQTTSGCVLPSQAVRLFRRWLMLLMFVVVYPAAQFLGGGSLRFCREPTDLGAERGPTGAAGFRHDLRLAISSFSRARVSARLASCVRCTRDVMINTPSCVARLPDNSRRRCRTSAGSERDWPTSKRSWTAVETLLTFWPPGPEARTKVIVSSESGMNMGKCYFQNSP